MRLSLRIWQRPGRCWSWWRWWRRSWSRCCTSRWSGWTRPCTSWGRQGGRESVTWGKGLSANICNQFFLQTFITKYCKAAVLRTKNELICTSLICPCMTWMRWSWQRWWWLLCNGTGLPKSGRYSFSSLFWFHFQGIAAVRYDFCKGHFILRSILFSLWNQPK